MGEVHREATWLTQGASTPSVIRGNVLSKVLTGPIPEPSSLSLVADERNNRRTLWILMLRTFVALTIIVGLGTAQAAAPSRCPSLYTGCMGHCDPGSTIGGAACKALCDKTHLHLEHRVGTTCAT
jgi:hypothetical protein